MNTTHSVFLDDLLFYKKAEIPNMNPCYLRTRLELATSSFFQLSSKICQKMSPKHHDCYMSYINVKGQLSCTNTLVYGLRGNSIYNFFVKYKNVFDFCRILMNKVEHI